MKLIRIVLLCIFACSINAEQPKNILFVGNSYLYYNNSVHNYVEFMLREHYDSDIETKLSAIGGSRLHHHNIDHLLDFKNLNLVKISKPLSENELIRKTELKEQIRVLSIEHGLPTELICTSKNLINFIRDIDSSSLNSGWRSKIFKI